MTGLLPSAVLYWAKATAWLLAAVISLVSVVAPRTRFSDDRHMAPASAAAAAAVLSWARATAIIAVSTASAAKPMKTGNISPNMMAATPRRDRAALSIICFMEH